MSKKATITILLIIFWTTLPAQSWHGFSQDTFTFQNHSAWIIKPADPLPGNPWIWRARFPNWHFEMDSILVDKGYHVAFINLNNQYGSPKAVSVWNNFYDHLILEHNFALQPILEGVSRGGLFVYNWAKINPGKVSCIYAEAPVCDFLSWPGGKGSGVGSLGDWQNLLKAYDFQNENQAFQFQGQPIHSLDQLAELKVPILHVVSLQDSIVPFKENTKILVNKYIEAGGPAMIVPVSGPVRLNGHHFDIPNPRSMANLVHQLAESKPKVNYKSYVRIRNGLPNLSHKLGKQDSITVAFLGGSITYNPGWRTLFINWMRSTYPNQKFNFISTGIPSMGSTPHAFRLERDVLSKGKIDLLILEAAVNDQSNGRTDREQLLAMEGIVRHTLQTNQQTDILILHFADPAKLNEYRSGNTPPVIHNHEKVAAHYQIPSLHLAEEMFARIQNKEFTWELDFKNLHPSPFGQRLYFHSLKNIFLECLTSSKVKSPLPEPMNRYHFGSGKIMSITKAKPYSGWQINSNWIPEDGAGTRTGYTQVPMLCSKKPGAKLTVPFSGPLIGIAVAAGPDAGIIQYRVDRGAWKELNLFTRWSKHLHLPWYHVLEESLPPGKHKLYIKVAAQTDPQSTGHACRIKHFVTNEVP